MDAVRERSTAGPGAGSRSCRSSPGTPVPPPLHSPACPGVAGGISVPPVCCWVRVLYNPLSHPTASYTHRADAGTRGAGTSSGTSPLPKMAAPGLPAMLYLVTRGGDVPCCHQLPMLSPPALGGHCHTPRHEEAAALRAARVGITP